MHQAVGWSLSCVLVGLALGWATLGQAQEECPQDCAPSEMVGGCCPVAAETPKSVEKEKRRKKSVPDGTDGGKCYGNGTCNDGLLCGDDGVCRAPRSGQAGGPCYGNGTCDMGLTCHSGLCMVPTQGMIGGTCYRNGTCNRGALCSNGVCVDSHGFDYEACLELCGSSHDTCGVLAHSALTRCDTSCADDDFSCSGWCSSDYERDLDRCGSDHVNCIEACKRGEFVY